MRSSLNVRATLVADEFIDRYMPAANGEYVKVYLYLLRHQDRAVTEVELADALNHTESDIHRAMTYWKRLGILAESEENGAEGAEKDRDQAVQGVLEADQGGRAEEAGTEDAPGGAEEADAGSRKTDMEPEKKEEENRADIPQAAGSVNSTVANTRIPTQRTPYTPEQVRQLGDDEDFTQLLYIAQKYMNKVFTPRECEVFAYLYDGLKMPAEMLEYLVEYCVQGGHYSIRYLETVALNWHEKGIRTVEAARQYTASFNGEAFSVMKAFGLSDRRPGDSEMEMIRRWFQEWGFTKDLVMEACSRTLRATQKPSFAYADKILGEWKKAGVRAKADVAKLDQARDSRKPQASGQTAGSRNRFHNFEQRDTNYDAIVLERLKERLGEQ